jgi:integrase
MLRVNPTGTKAYYIQLDKNRKRKIGDASVLSATLARYRAKDILSRHLAFPSSLSGKGRKPSLEAFLNGPYKEWKSRQSRYGQRDIKRLCTALSPLATERIDQVGRSQIERWKLKRASQVSPATLNRELASFKAALNRAREWNLLADNPARGVKPVKGDSVERIRMLQADERERLLAALAARDDHIRALTLLALNTGLRRNELFRLRWRDVSLGPYPLLTVEKSGVNGKKVRKIPLNKTAASLLKEWRSRSPHRGFLVFRNASGGQLRSISTGWRRLTKDAAIHDFRFNDCRHDFACRLVQAGTPLTQVAELLGLSSVNMAKRYAPLAPGSVKDAVARLDPE